MNSKLWTFLPLLVTLLAACAGIESKSQDFSPEGWLELPEVSEKDNASFFTHFMTAEGMHSRNYSFLWDYGDLVARWVAYPLCRDNIGTGRRSNEWGLNPYLSRDDQPVLIRGYAKGNKGYYDRGHQVPSADRLSRAANVQTFYGTNMTPQDSDLNAGLWNSIEIQVRDWARRTDTLYVVSGCVTEGSGYYALDNDGKKVTVPVGYYKALLRYDKSGSDGPAGFLGLAVYVENRPYPGVEPDKSMTMSIDELEKRVGIDFFVNLPDDIELEIEAQQPEGYDWWWK